MPGELLVPPNFPPPTIPARLVGLRVEVVQAVFIHLLPTAPLVERGVRPVLQPLPEVLHLPGLFIPAPSSLARF